MAMVKISEIGSDIHVQLYCGPVIFRSSTKPSILALPILPRSRKASKYKTLSMGIKRISILRRTAASSTELKAALMELSSCAPRENSNWRSDAFSGIFSRDFDMETRNNSGISELGQTAATKRGAYTLHTPHNPRVLPRIELARSTPGSLA